jgi:hypothetical protein
MPYMHDSRGGRGEGMEENQIRFVVTGEFKSIHYPHVNGFLV